MLNPDRLFPADNAAPMEGRNPFYLGEFQGERLQEARARRAGVVLVGSLLIALVLVSFMAAQAWWNAAHPSACRVSAVDWTGEEYVVGQGDTLREAMVGAVLPPNPSDVFVIDGCDR